MGFPFSLDAASGLKQGAHLGSPSGDGGLLEAEEEGSSPGFGAATRIPVQSQGCHLLSVHMHAAYLRWEKINK